MGNWCEGEGKLHEVLGSYGGENFKLRVIFLIN